MYRTVSQDELLSGRVEEFCELDHIRIDNVGAAFFQIPVCCKGYLQPVGQFLLRKLPCLSNLADIVLYRRIVHNTDVGRGQNYPICRSIINKKIR